MKILPTQFDGHAIRRLYDEATDTWWFSVMDVVQVLTQQPDALIARKYWNQLKSRLAKEGSELVTACHQLKLPAADGKQRLTDCATAESLLRLVQSIPSPKAEPIKLWLAKVGYERMQEMAQAIEAGALLVVGLDGRPGRCVGVGAGEHGFLGGGVVLPAVQRFQIHRGQLPAPHRVDLDKEQVLAVVKRFLEGR